MNHLATITRFELHPMVDFVPSTLNYWLRLENGHEIMMEASNTLEHLSQVFGFKIVNDSEWDFTGFIGRKCWVMDTTGGLRFVSMA